VFAGCELRHRGDPARERRHVHGLIGVVWTPKRWAFATAKTPKCKQKQALTI
jgi:hypothetical protein